MLYSAWLLPTLVLFFSYKTTVSNNQSALIFFLLYFLYYFLNWGVIFFLFLFAFSVQILQHGGVSPIMMIRFYAFAFGAKVKKKKKIKSYQHRTRRNEKISKVRVTREIMIHLFWEIKKVSLIFLYTNMCICFIFLKTKYTY